MDLVEGGRSGRPSGTLAITELPIVSGDICSTATPVSAGTVASPAIVNYDTAQSVVNESFANSGLGQDIWFVVTPTVTGGLTASLCGQAGTTFSSSIRLYSSCELAGALDESNPAENGGFPCSTSAQVTAGIPVYIRVAQTLCPGAGQFSLVLDPTVLPGNDTCQAAFNVSEGSTPFDNTFAATNTTEPCENGPFSGGKDLFFRFTPTVSSSFEFSVAGTEPLPLGSSSMAVYTGSACDGPLVACSNTGFSPNFEVLLQAGQPYTIRVAGVGSPTGGTPPLRGNGNLVIRRVVPPTNDACSSARNITAGNHSFDLTDASPDGQDRCTTTATVDDVWFRYTPSFTGSHELALNLDASGTLPFDNSEINIVTACGQAPSVVSGRSIDPATGAQFARLVFQGVSGQPVLVRVAATVPFPLRGTGQLYAGAARQPFVPSNDLCASPITLQPGLNPFTLANATASVPPCYPDSNCATDSCTVAISEDVFFNFTATQSGLISIKVDDGEPYFDGTSSNAGAVLSILPNCGGAPVVCGLPCGDFPADSIRFQVTAGQSYLLRVGKYTFAPWDSMGGTLAISYPCGPADIASEGGAPGDDGVLDNNDFIVFISLFFEQASGADIGLEGGASGSDGIWDNNDFIVFIRFFFEGC